MQAVKALVKTINDKLEINFYNPVSAPAKGQACVIYDLKDKHLIAGGWID